MINPQNISKTEGWNIQMRDLNTFLVMVSIDREKKAVSWHGELLEEKYEFITSKTTV